MTCVAGKGKQQVTESPRTQNVGIQASQSDLDPAAPLEKGAFAHLSTHFHVLTCMKGQRKRKRSVPPVMEHSCWTTAVRSRRQIDQESISSVQFGWVGADFIWPGDITEANVDGLLDDDKEEGPSSKKSKKG